MKKLCAMILMGLMLAAAPALALDLSQAKAQGWIGEKPDGLVGAIDNRSDIKALVDKINAERLERYKAVATKNGTPLAQVQALAGKQLIDRTPAGEYIMSPGGQWQKKR